MANTFVFNGQVLDVIAIDTDWTWSDHWTKNPPKVRKITFTPAAAGDQCVIKIGSAAGPVVFDSGVAQAGFVPVSQDFGGEPLELFLDVSDGTFNASARLVIVEQRAMK